jgi:hypothetical protein
LFLYLAIFISSLSPSANVALTLAAPILVPLMIFSGYLLNYDSMPKYFAWIRYLSWFSYSNELLLLNQWDDVKNLTCRNNDSFCFKNGSEVITFLKLNPNNYQLNILCLCAIMIFWRVFAYFILLIKTKQR